MPVNYSGIFAPTRSLRISCVIILIEDDYKSKFALSFRLLQFRCANHTVAVPLQWPEERPTTFVVLEVITCTCHFAMQVVAIVALFHLTRIQAHVSQGEWSLYHFHYSSKEFSPQEWGPRTHGVYVKLQKNELFYSFRFTFLESNSKNGVNYYIGELLLSLSQASVCMSYKNLLH